MGDDPKLVIDPSLSAEIAIELRPRFERRRKIDTSMPVLKRDTVKRHKTKADG